VVGRPRAAAQSAERRIRKPPRRVAAGYVRVGQAVVFGSILGFVWLVGWFGSSAGPLALRGRAIGRRCGGGSACMLVCGAAWGGWSLAMTRFPGGGRRTVGEGCGRSRRQIGKVADHRKICKEHAAIGGQLELTLDRASNERNRVVARDAVPLIGGCKTQRLTRH